MLRTMIIMLTACLAANVARGIEPSAQFKGTIENEAIASLPNAAAHSGFVANDADFDKLWAAWSKEKRPDVDFTKNFILVDLQDAADPNRRGHSFKVNDEGALELVSFSTLIGFEPSSRSKYTMFVLPREGVKGIVQFEQKDGGVVRKVVPLPPPGDMGGGAKAKE